MTTVAQEWLLHIFIVLLFAFAGLMYWLLTKDLVGNILLPQLLYRSFIFPNWGPFVTMPSSLFQWTSPFDSNSESERWFSWSRSFATSSLADRGSLCSKPWGIVSRSIVSNTHSGLIKLAEFHAVNKIYGDGFCQMVRQPSLRLENSHARWMLCMLHSNFSDIRFQVVISPD